MLGTGPDTPSGARGEGLPNPTMHAVGTNTFLQSGSCAFIWAFAFNMYERKASPVGTIHEVDIDVNNDGTYDYFVINQDVGGVTALSDGRQVTAVINAKTGASIARFFVEHATNSANVILYACGGDLGLTQASIGQPMKANFFTYSWYFGGAESHLGPFLITPYGEEFTAAVPGDVLTYKQQGNLAVQQWGLFPGTDPNAGVLLINNSDFGASNRGGATKATEATLLPR
jgi:hypothetical protein